MRSDRTGGGRGGLVVVLVSGLLVCGGLNEALGMEQTGPQFGAAKEPMAEEAMPEAEMPTAAGYRAERMAPPVPPKPAPVTRDKTTVKLVLEPKYADEEDAQLRRYEATFEGKYVIRNKLKEKTTVAVYFPYPSDADTLPDATVHVEGKEPEGVRYTQQGVSWETTFLPEQVKEITVAYRAFGREDFLYVLDHGERIKELEFTLEVPGMEHTPEIPSDRCLKPTRSLERGQGGLVAEWKYKNLLTAHDIALELPPPFVGSNVAERLPRLVWAALATIVLFGLILLAGGAASRQTVTVGQYLLVAVALAVFYPMLLYLSQHMRVHLAFFISFVAVSALVLGSLRRWHGIGFAVGYGGLGLVILLGVFSAAALATKGSGALVTIGLLVLVGFAMRTAPAISVARPKAPPGEPPPAGAAVAEEEERWAEAEPELEPPQPPPAARRYCAFCGGELAEGFSFCPQCGENARIALACPECGTQICLQCHENYRFCPGCGAALPTREEPQPEQTE